MEQTPQNNIDKLMQDKGFEFRDFRNLKIETRMQGETEELVVEGVACTFNDPTVLYEYDGIEYKEQIDDKAFAECDMTDVIFNYNHCGRVYAKTRNKSLEIWTEEDGLHMRAHLRKDDVGHIELYNDIKTETIDRMSFAFTIQEQSYDSENYIRTIRKVKKLYDVSAVDIPAYDTTSISARSFFDAERGKELKEIEEREKQLNLAKARYFYAQI